MIVKIHKNPDGRKVVAICDNDLLGKRFEEGKLQLDLSSNFYKGEEMSEDDVVGLTEDPCIVNVVGEKSINFLIGVGVVDKKNIIRIKGIPHAQAIVG